MKRRNLSGIFILDKLDGDEKELPTCIEDCKEETLDKWLEKLDKEALTRTVKLLSEVVRQIGDEFNIVMRHE